VERAMLFIGIDSGPQKIAFSTNTPVLAIWVANHPYHFADNTANAIHLIPENHQDLLRGDKNAAMKFFEKHYWYVPYAPYRLGDAIKLLAGRFISARI
jgi:hypothetical protein